ncbi:hypothetical protein JX266_011181 [Neoarthrinium moseri]|nr:hypothetical protein JX266_011181 [Neoarthrinium moseri]
MYGIDDEALLNAFKVVILEQCETGGKNRDHLVVSLDPSLLRKAKKEADGDLDAFWKPDRRFSTLVQAMKADQDAGLRDDPASSLSKVKTATSVPEAAQIVVEHFKNKLSRVLMVPAEDFSEDNRSVTSYGNDSMIGAELRTWIFMELVLDPPFQQLLAPSLTIGKFSKLVCANRGIQQ